MSDDFQAAINFLGIDSCDLSSPLWLPFPVDVCRQGVGRERGDGCRASGRPPGVGDVERRSGRADRGRLRRVLRGAASQPGVRAGRSHAPAPNQITWAWMDSELVSPEGAVAD